MYYILKYTHAHLHTHNCPFLPTTLFPSGPDVDLPMDTVVSTKLQGSLEGHMMNGARLVAGQNGKALCLDAAFQYVEFSPGEEHECLKNPDHCSLGITFSMWLMDLGNTDFINIFLGNDGCQPTGIGFCFGFVPSAFFATIRGGSSAYRYRIPRSEKDTWEHIVIQFHPNGTIKFYKNGCDTYSYSIKEGYNMISPHSPESRWENKLFTLSHADNGAYIKLDDFLIWYDMILPDRIWKVYVQGGLVWLHYAPQYTFELTFCVLTFSWT